MVLEVHIGRDAGDRAALKLSSDKSDKGHRRVVASQHFAIFAVSQLWSERSRFAISPEPDVV